MTHKKLIIASGNSGKIKEISALFSPLEFECVSSHELNLPEPEETGKTFAENALIKAKSAANLSQCLSIADDSGFCVKALDNAPGLFSSRWAGAEKDFSNAMHKVWKAFLKADSQNKKAFFVCALALALPDHTSLSSTRKRKLGINSDLSKPYTLEEILAQKRELVFQNHIVFQGEIHGQLTWPPKGNFGFGYDPMFIPDQYQQSFAEMSPELKESMSHRQQAFKALLKSGILNIIYP